MTEGKCVGEKTLQKSKVESIEDPIKTEGENRLGGRIYRYQRRLRRRIYKDRGEYVEEKTL